MKLTDDVKQRKQKHFKQYRTAKQKLPNKENLVRFLHRGKPEIFVQTSLINLFRTLFVAGSFECQTCVGNYGNSKEEALKACDDSIEMVICDEEKPVCMVNHDNDGYFHTISRYCASKDHFEEQNQECDRTTILDNYECTVAMCKESGCKA